MPLTEYLNQVCLVCKKVHQGRCDDQDLTDLLEGPTSQENPFPFEGDM